MSRPSTRNPDPSELESCVLAFVARNGPCTAYAVRRYLAASESSYWSASSGAIYPLMDKLADVGWVTVHEEPFGQRTKRTYELSAEGRRRVTRWLSPPIPREAAAHTHDPIRTRLFFFDLVGPAERRALVEDAIEQTLDVLERHRRDYAEHEARENAWELVGRKGAMRELSARLEWLRGLRDEFEGDGA